MLRIWLLAALLTGCGLQGQAQQYYMNVHSGGKTISYPVEGVDSVTFSSVQPEQSQLAGPRITQTIVKEQEKATVYNIAYPSTDPYGNPVTLSGSIILGDEVLTDKHARGMLLYNHFTVYHKAQVPSMGDLGIPLKIVGSGMIAVAADYYGFGLTGDKNQAYCMSRHNAQASVDALIAARQLLKGLGYTWDDYLFNCGYSEGGQTSMGVLRLCTEKYPDIRFTHTIAGAGPYDIGETYRQLVKSGETSMPSTVISTLLAYNEYCRLGFGLSELFLEPTLSKIEEYLLSKEYVQQQVEANVATTKVHDWLTEPLFDFESTISRRFMEVFEYDNLSKGWTPHPEERISLVHNELDNSVPYANTTQMTAFFQQHGFNVIENGDRYRDGTVLSYHGSWDARAISDKLGQHEFGALPFVSEIIQVVCHYLDIKPWFTISAQDLEVLFH